MACLKSQSLADGNLDVYGTRESGASFAMHLLSKEQLTMGPTAVVVDDSCTMRHALGVALAWAGVTVVAEGRRGSELLALYELYRPTLIILDIVRLGMEGVSATSGLLQKYPGAPLVVCSSALTPEKFSICQQLGLFHYLRKPFTSEQVAKLVSNVLEGRANREPPEIVEHASWA